MSLSEAPPMMKSRRCSGFTLLELILVIAIIGVMLGLLVPAVQKVRDAGNRANCANNLKQIGLALHHYHGSYSVFPPGVSSENGKDAYPHLSWLARSLPYVEQQELWRRTEDAYRQDRDPFHNP